MKPHENGCPLYVKRHEPIRSLIDDEKSILHGSVLESVKVEAAPRKVGTIDENGRITFFPRPRCTCP